MPIQSGNETVIIDFEIRIITGCAIRRALKFFEILFIKKISINVKKIIGIRVPRNNILTPAPKPTNKPILIEMSLLILIVSVFRYFIT